MKVYPSPVTVRDQQVNVVANISSSLPLRNVQLLVAETNSTTFPQALNYARVFMYMFNTINGSEYWEAQLPRESHPTNFAVYVNATDSENDSALWPTPTTFPLIIPVELVPSSQMYPPQFEISGLTLGLDYSYVNLTITHAVAELPYASEGGFLQIFMLSEPHGYGIQNPLTLIEEANNRFVYVGNGTFSTELSGSTASYPYDSYVFGLNMSIPYPNLNYTKYRVSIFPSNQIASSFQDSWQISNTQQDVYYRGNTTFLVYSFTLQRSNQPLAFPLIAVADIILLASALVFASDDIDKRLTVYLTSVVISVSVLISQGLNPFGFGITLFEYFFAYLMLANALLIAGSILGWRVGSRKHLAAVVDVSGGLIVAFIAYHYFGPTPMPWFIWSSMLLVPAFALVSRFVDSRSSSDVPT